MKISSIIEEMGEALKLYGAGATLEEMERRTLKTKGINGATAAHYIEEIHTPSNIAYTTFTTGTSAFQSIVGVTYSELENRKGASFKALNLAGVKAGDSMLITYPPLVSVFSGDALKDYGVEVIFMPRPSRDAFLYTLATKKPRAVLGESSFIRASIVDAQRLGILEVFPKNLIILLAGTPLDLELLELGNLLKNPSFYDFYGCQEFGWLMVNGAVVREDIQLLNTGENTVHTLVGGLSTGDIFSVGASHILGGEGSVPTYSRIRSNDYIETVITHTTARDKVSILRTATSVLRLKSKVVRLSEDIKFGEAINRLEIHNFGKRIGVVDKDKMGIFEELLAAQLEYQGGDKNNPVWSKKSTHEVQ